MANTLKGKKIVLGITGPLSECDQTAASLNGVLRRSDSEVHF